MVQDGRNKASTTLQTPSFYIHRLPLPAKRSGDKKTDDGEKNTKVNRRYVYYAITDRKVDVKAGKRQLRTETQRLGREHFTSILCINILFLRRTEIIASNAI